MSVYTPSTGEVRRRYAYARSDKPRHKNQSAIAEFDRWLAAHDAEVLATAALRRPAQTEPTDAQIAAMTDPNSITDEQADAAQLAHYRFVFGEEGLPNRRELGIYRQAMKVAISEAVRAAQGEPSDTTPEGAEVTFFTQLDSDYAEESATLAQAEHVRREASGLIPPAGRKITKRVTYWVDMPAAFTAGQEGNP